MKKYRLICNPYTVSNKLFLVTGNGDKRISENSALSRIENNRLQKWLHPDGAWKGFFAELAKVSGTNEMKLAFVGIKEDFEDLVYAAKLYNPALKISVEITSELNAAEQMKISSGYKLAEVDNLLKNIKKDNSLISPALSDYFTNELNLCFEIHIVGPLFSSCGKTTLINALLGHRILPTSCATAVLARTIINNTNDDFSAELIDRDGKKEIPIEQINQAFVKKINDKRGNDGKPIYHCINLEGPSKQFADTMIRYVFEDVPCSNNVSKGYYGFETEHLFNMKENSIILFVFTVNTLQYDSTKQVLKQFVNSVKSKTNGIMSEDRILFVCTGSDTIIDRIAKIKEYSVNTLSTLGFQNPKLFMVNARYIEAFRMEEYNKSVAESRHPERVEIFTRREKIFYKSDLDSLGDSDDLFRYQTVPHELMQEFEKQMDSLVQERNEYYEKTKEIENNYLLNEDEKDDLTRKYRKPLFEAKKQIAYINSGIPALEYAIRDYLNKYVIPIKIQKIKKDCDYLGEFLMKVNKLMDIEKTKE